MPITSMPAIDQQVCAGWTEQQRNLYRALPFYLAKMQVEKRAHWATWSKFYGKKRWKPNQGPLMIGIRSEPSPNMRQFAFPSPIDHTPTKDVMNVREVESQAIVFRHRFESPVLDFYPSFNDFMDHVDETAKDIMDKIDRYEDLFLRGMTYHSSPYAFLVTANGVRLVQSNPYLNNAAFVEATDGKTAAWLAAQLPLITGDGLPLQSINAAVTIMEDDLRIPFFSGSDLPKDDAPLAGKYCLILPSEAYNQFMFDPFLLANKNCVLDIINESFKGQLFGRVTCRLEDLPLRFTTTGTYHQPEVRVEGGAPYNLGETLPNPNYTGIDTSPIGVAFLVGASGADSIEVGPPPSAFTANTPPHNFPGMFWNGEVKATKQFLIPCINPDDGTIVWEMNTYGEKMKWISQATFGVLFKQRRNVIPIIYKRKRGTP